MRAPISFVKTTASIDVENNIVTINTSKENLGWGYEGQQRLLKPWWVNVSAAFIFETPDGPCATLVRRVGETRHSGKWALLPAGTTDNVCELLHPEEALYREIEEEFHIIKDGKCIDPMKHSNLLKKEKVTIINIKLPERTNKTCGEIYQRNGQVYLIRVYKVNLCLDDVIIFDGEEGPNGKSLDRLVAIVPLNKLKEEQVKPVAVFKSKKRFEPARTREIYLSGEKTDTLQWLIENREIITDLLRA